MQFDRPKRREPTKLKPLPATFLWLLGGVAVAVAALPAIFVRSPASEQNKELAVLTASSMQSKQDKELAVLAASSMQNALDDINAAFTNGTGIKVTARYAATSALIKQISQGAAADVFVSGGPDWVDWGVKENLLKDARVNLLGNRLVLIAPKDSKLDSVAIGPNFDLANLAGDGSIAIGDVREAPVGKYAKAALEKLERGKLPRQTLMRANRTQRSPWLHAESAAWHRLRNRCQRQLRREDNCMFPQIPPAIIHTVAATVTAKPTAVGYIAYLRSMTSKEIFERYGFEFDPANVVGVSDFVLLLLANGTTRKSRTSAIVPAVGGQADIGHISSRALA